MGTIEAALPRNHGTYLVVAGVSAPELPAVVRIFRELPDEQISRRPVGAGNKLLRRWRVLDAGVAWAGLAPTLKH